MTTTPFRTRLSTRLAGIATATLIASAALVAAATAPAFAAPSADMTQLSLDVSSNSVTQGTAFTAEAVVTLADTPPVGTVTIVVDGPGVELSEVSQHVTSNKAVAVSISDAPVGTVTVHAHFTPDRAIDQSSADAYQTVTVAKKLTPGSSVSLSTTKLVAGRSNAVVATVTVPTATTSFGGAVHLEVGTASDVAVCTPTAVTSTTAECTLNVPAYPTGTQAANASWNGSADFAEADYTTSLVFAPAPAAAPVPAPKSGSTSHGTSTSSATSPSPAAATAPSTLPSTVPSSTPSTVPSTHTGASHSAPTSALGSVAAQNADAVSPLPTLYIVLVAVALLLIAGVIALVVVTRRRAAR